MSRHAKTVIGVLCSGVACTDYGLNGWADPGGVGLDDSAEPALACEEVRPAGVAWAASGTFTEMADPVDSAGVPFWQPDFDDQTWSSLTLPDVGSIPAGTDRAYRGDFELDALPDSLAVNLQSDDGLELWLNGQAVGAWGGGWQQEGCVNDDPGCLLSDTVAPVDVADWLVVGPNVLAARVSNAIEGAYLDLELVCPERL